MQKSTGKERRKQKGTYHANPTFRIEKGCALGVQKVYYVGAGGMC
jgi:hypothetical protein